MDQGVLERYRRKQSVAALHDVLRIAQAWCFHAAFPVLRQREDAEDVTQEVLLRLLDDLPSIQDSDHLRHWVRRVGLNKAIDARRIKQRRTTREQREAQRDRVDPPSFDDDDRVLVHTCIAQLDDDAQDLICSYFFDKEPIRVLAEQRSCSTTVAWKRLKRAKEELAGKLDRAGYSTLIPGVISYLEGVESASPGALPATVVARAQQIATLATSSSALAIGGMILTTKKALLALSLVLLIGAGLGGGLTQYLMESATPVSDHGISDNEAVNAADTAATDSDTILEEKLRAFKLENQALRDQLAAHDSSPRAVADETMTPEQKLIQRLTQLSTWFEVSKQRIESVDNNDDSAVAALQEELEKEMLAQSAGLQELILLSPNAFFDFLRRGDQHDAYYYVAFNIAQGKQKGKVARISGYDALPAAFTQGLFDLLTEDNAVLRQASLQLISNLRGIPAGRLDDLRAMVMSKDRRAAGMALRTLNINAGVNPAAFNKEIEREVLRIIDHENDPILVSSAIHALHRADKDGADTRLLELLERGQLLDHQSEILSVLSSRVRRTAGDNHARYAQAMTATLRAGINTWTFDQAVSVGVQLGKEHRLAVLERARSIAPDNVRADVLDTLLAEIDGASSQLLDIYNRAVHPEMYSPSPSSVATETHPVVED